MNPVSLAVQPDLAGWLRCVLPWLAVVMLCAPASAGPPPTPSVAWRTVTPGLELGRWDAGNECDDDVPPLIVVKVDPERYRFATHHYADEKLPAPLTMKEWQRRTGAVLLFNAGLFRDDYSYMGWLFKDGRPLAAKRHPQWQGLFVAEPAVPGLRKARVVDLAVEPFSMDTMMYREAAQSLMLLDQNGKPRVRQSGKRAHQTVVAEDRDGNILLFKTTDSVGLWDLALCLRDEWALHQAMVMDGGGSSELMLDAQVASHHGAVLQPYHTLVDGSGLGHIPLPAVIGVMPRAGP